MLQVLAIVDGAKVFYDDMPEKQAKEMVHHEYHYQMGASSLLSGGAQVMRVNSQFLKTLVSNEQVSKHFTPKGINYLLSLEEGYYVSISRKVRYSLSKKEREALKLHEVGHVVYGLPDGISRGKRIEGTHFVLSLEDELFADNYAADRVGAKAMHDAIVKLIRMRSKKLVEINPAHTAEQYFEADMKDEILQERLKTLSYKM
jgi:hypothetical protein